jgi:hypothetical protein
MMPDGKIVVHLQQAQSVRFPADIHIQDMYEALP